MRLHSQLLAFTCSCLLAITFVGCSSKNVQITEGHMTREPATVINRDTPLVVHVDLFDRIVTVRNGTTLGDQFLITTNYAGVETAVLKKRASSFSETLLTADILEGEPAINNTVKTAGAARSLELAKTYRAVGEGN